METHRRLAHTLRDIANETRYTWCMTECLLALLHHSHD